jgi:hypothetical protein
MVIEVMDFIVKGATASPQIDCGGRGVQGRRGGRLSSIGEIGGGARRSGVVQGPNVERWDPTNS